MFEHRSQPLLHRRKFIHRSLTYVAFSAGLLLFSLLLGMAGYHFIAGISCTDAFYNASMILTGMGPALDIDNLRVGDIPVSIDCKNRIKIFAGLYALYSGVIFLAASGLILSPILHRFFHKMHLDIKD
jgi:hypothetical protein